MERKEGRKGRREREGKVRGYSWRAKRRIFYGEENKDASRGRQLATVLRGVGGDPLAGREYIINCGRSKFLSFSFPFSFFSFPFSLFFSFSCLFSFLFFLFFFFFSVFFGRIYRREKEWLGGSGLSLTMGNATIARDRRHRKSGFSTNLEAWLSMRMHVPARP